MHILSIVLTVVLLAMVVGSAAMDFQGPQQIKDLMARLEYRPGFERTLGLIKLTGALGLLIGFWAKPLAILTALCFVAYFVLAVGAHRKLNDPAKEMAPAAFLLVVSGLVVITTLFA